MISVKDPVKRPGDTEVLKGISITVEQGDVDAVIGPSGGGKSTCLRCINGLEPFQGGEVRVDDLVLTPKTTVRGDARLLELVRRRVGFVFQQFNLFPHLTGLQNLTEAPIQVLGLSRDEAVDGRVGLAAKLNAKPKDLSGGQMQRVAIARTLAMQPGAILFDEPTSALDPMMAGEVLALIADLAKDGQTMVVVTHSMHFARSAANKVRVFAGGHDVEFGAPAVVFGNPQHPTTKSFLKRAS